MCNCIERLHGELIEHYKKQGKEIDYFYDMSSEWEGHYKHTAKTGNITNKVVKFTVQGKYCPHCGGKN